MECNQILVELISQHDGRCGCGIVIKGAGTDSDIAVPLKKECGALVAELVGVKISIVVAFLTVKKYC